MFTSFHGCVLCADMDYNFQRNLLYLAAVETNGPSIIKVAQIQKQMTGERFNFTLKRVFFYLIIEEVYKMLLK